VQEQQRREKAQLKQLKQLEKPEKEQEQKRRAKSAGKELQKEATRLGKMPSVAAPKARAGTPSPTKTGRTARRASRARARARARLSSKGARTTAGATELASRSVVKVKADLMCGRRGAEGRACCVVACPCEGGERRAFA
jgi:hypothetical protein